MGPVVIVTRNKRVEAGLLLQQVVGGRSCRLLLEGQMHALVAAVLLGMTGLDAFDRDTGPQPPDREPAQAKQGMGRGERYTVVGADCPAGRPNSLKAYSKTGKAPVSLVDSSASQANR